MAGIEDHVVVMTFGVSDVLGQGFAVYVYALLVKQVQYLLEECRSAASVEEVFHQVFAGGFEVGDYRDSFREFIPLGEG